MPSPAAANHAHRPLSNRFSLIVLALGALAGAAEAERKGKLSSHELLFGVGAMRGASGTSAFTRSCSCTKAGYVERIRSPTSGLGNGARSMARWA